jgi:pimeloyl-ACP methyl ester carboxylesterase
MGIESLRPTTGAPHDPYEMYFKNPEVLNVEGGRVEVVDLVPERQKTEVPLVLVPGWSSGIETHKHSAKLLAESGRRVVGISATHGMTPEKMAHENAPLAELRKAEAVMLALDERKIEKADILTHSEGALFVTAAALAHPERFRNIVYYAPAGLIGEDSFWELGARFHADTVAQFKDRDKEEGRRERMDVSARGVAASILSNPARSLEEVKAIATTQIQENLRALHEKGIGIIIMHPVGDRGFPMERMTQMVKGDMVDGFISVGDPSQTGVISDTHNALFLSPDKFTPAVDAILDTLERKAKRREKEEEIPLDKAA